MAARAAAAQGAENRALELLGLVLLVGLIASLFPGWRAYRLSLADGLTPRV